MKIVFSIITSVFLFFTSAQSIEEAEALFNKEDYKAALKVLKKCKKSDAVDLFKAQVNYKLGYDNFACESLKNMDTEEAALLYDSLCIANFSNLIILPGDSEGNIFFEEVVKVDSNLTKQELYVNAKEWFAKTFVSAQDVIQMDDKEVGRIIGKGNMEYNSTIYYGSNGTKGWIRYTVTIQVKDGRYKYEISNFVHEGNSLNSYGAFSFGLITNNADCTTQVTSTASPKWKNKVWNDIKIRIDSYTPLIISSLKEEMSKSPEFYEDEDW